MTNLPASVRIVEVGPRDGLQNEAQSIDLQTRLTFIRQLVAAGLRTIEAGSFVNPQRVPQMAGSDELFVELLNQRTAATITYTALTPNLIGLNRAIDCGVKEVAVFAAASEAFSQKNINCSFPY